MAKFWWGRKEERRQFVLGLVEKMKEKKKKRSGGLGFRELKCFNLASESGVTLIGGTGWAARNSAGWFQMGGGRAD